MANRKDVKTSERKPQRDRTMHKKDLVIVIGKTSQLALAMQDYLLQHAKEFGDTIFFFDRKTLDITSPQSIHSALSPFIQNRESYRQVAIVNTVAYTQVEKAEDEPEEARRVNVLGVQHLAELAYQYRWGLIHISTDFVFDGYKQTPYSEEDLPSPLSVYGTTKLEGEKALSDLQQVGLGMVIRTSWLHYYKATHGNFLLSIAKKITSQTPLKVVADQVGAPTNAYDLAEFILLALKLFFNEGQFRVPLLHFCNSGKATWYDFAVAIADSLGSSIAIQPIATEEYPTNAVRPRYSLLSTHRLQSVYHIHPREWTEGVAENIRLLQKEKRA